METYEERMKRIKQQNLEILKRHKEVEEDRKNAVKAKATLKKTPTLDLDDMTPAERDATLKKSMSGSFFENIQVTVECKPARSLPGHSQDVKTRKDQQAERKAIPVTTSSTKWKLLYASDDEDSDSESNLFNGDFPRVAPAFTNFPTMAPSTVSNGERPLSGLGYKHLTTEHAIAEQVNRMTIIPRSDYYVPPPSAEPQVTIVQRNDYCVPPTEPQVQNTIRNGFYLPPAEPQVTIASRSDYYVPQQAAEPQATIASRTDYYVPQQAAEIPEENLDMSTFSSISFNSIPSITLQNQHQQREYPSQFLVNSTRLSELEGADLSKPAISPNLCGPPDALQFLPDMDLSVPPPPLGSYPLPSSPSFNVAPYFPLRLPRKTDFNQSVLGSSPQSDDLSYCPPMVFNQRQDSSYKLMGRTPTPPYGQIVGRAQTPPYGQTTHSQLNSSSLNHPHHFSPLQGHAGISHAYTPVDQGARGFSADLGDYSEPILNLGVDDIHHDSQTEKLIAQAISMAGSSHSNSQNHFAEGKSDNLRDYSGGSQPFAAGKEIDMSSRMPPSNIKVLRPLLGRGDADQIPARSPSPASSQSSQCWLQMIQEDDLAATDLLVRPKSSLSFKNDVELIVKEQQHSRSNAKENKLPNDPVSEHPQAHSSRDKNVAKVAPKRMTLAQRMEAARADTTKRFSRSHLIHNGRNNDTLQVFYKGSQI